MGVKSPCYAPNPFPYQGSKRRIAPQILGYLPRPVTRLVEPFAGSAAASIAVSMNRGRFPVLDQRRP